MPKPAGTTYTPSIYVEFAFGYGALADTTEGSWTNVTTAYPNDLVVDDIEIHRGRPSEFDEFPVGVASVTFKDRTRRLDPSNASGPYYANLKPRTPMRIRAVHSATSYVRFTGYVDGWPVQSGRGHSLVKIRGSDAFKLFASTTLPNIYDTEVLSDSPQAYWRLGEATGTRAVDSSTTRSDGEYLNAEQGHPSVVPYGGDGSLGGTLRQYQGVVVADASAKVGSGGTGSFTVSMWIRSDGDRTDAEGDIGSGERHGLYRQGAGGAYAYGFAVALMSKVYVQSTDWASYTNFGTVGNVTNVLRVSLVSAPTAVKYYAAPTALDGRSHHIVFKVSVVGGAISSYKVYYDGAPDGLTLVGDTNAFVESDSSPEIYIGNGPSVQEELSFFGDIDNVAVFASALSDQTVLDHYNAGTAPWDNETTGVRIGRVLDLIGWPSALRDIDGGEMLCGPAVLDGKSALEYLQTIARSEQGRLFMSHDGKVTFHQRDRFLTQSTESTSQYIFSDDGAGNAVIDAPTYDYDERYIYNRAVVTREGGDPQQVDNTSSQATYGAATRSLSGLALRDDRHSRALADTIVARYATPQVRVGDWSLQPQLDADSWASIFGLRIGYRVTVENKPSNNGTQIVSDMHIESITEKITPQTWSIKYSGSPVDPNAANYFTWGGNGATQGWGVGVWR